MKHTLIWRYWFGIGLLMFAVLAQATVSQIHTLSGTVSIAYAGQAARAAQKGDRLEVGTQVATGEKSFAMLRFADGQVVALKSNSEFRVDEYRFNPKVDKDNKIGFTASKGGLRAITGLIGKKNPDGFKLDTPTATIGIRGTTFDIFIDGGTFIRVTDGKIAIVNPAGLLQLAAGQIAAIASRQTPPAPTTEGALPPGAKAGFQELENIIINNLPPTGAGGGDGEIEIEIAPPPPPPPPPKPVPPVIPPPPPPPDRASLDVFFLAAGYDSSDSMTPLYQAMQGSNILDLLARANDILPDGSGNIRWGVGRYFDDPYDGVPSDAYQLQQAMTPSRPSGQAAIEAWSDDSPYYGSGGNFYAIQQVAESGAVAPRADGTGQNTGWRTGVNAYKTLLVFGDTPSLQSSVSEKDLGDILKREGISASFIDAYDMDGRYEGNHDPNAWRSADYSQAAGAAQELADLTGGVYIRLPGEYSSEALTNELFRAIANPLLAKAQPYSGGYMNSLNMDEAPWRTRTARSVLAAAQTGAANKIDFVLTYPFQEGVEFTLDTAMGTTVTDRTYKQAGSAALSNVDLWGASLEEDSFAQWSSNKDFYRFLLEGSTCSECSGVVEGYFGNKLATRPSASSGVTVFDLFSSAHDNNGDRHGASATPSGDLMVNWATGKVFALDKSPLFADEPEQNFGFFIGAVNPDSKKIEGRYYGFELCNDCEVSTVRPELDDARRGNTNMQLYGTGSTPAGFGGTFGAYWYNGDSYAYTNMMLTGLVSTPSQSYEFTPSVADGSNVFKGFAAAYVRQEKYVDYEVEVTVIPALSGGTTGSPDDVVITLDHSGDTLTGTLTASVTTRELEDGGTWTGTEHTLDATSAEFDSAYVSPKAFGVIGTSNGEESGLVTATKQTDTLTWPSEPSEVEGPLPTNHEFQYLSWGRWGSAEVPIDDGKQSIEPESLWVAGPLTPVETLTALSNDAGEYGYGKSGTYRGEVRGYRVDASGLAAPVTGTTNLTANFRATSNQLSGSLNNLKAGGVTWIETANLVNVGWTPGTNAITGNLANPAEGVTGTINGAFFGLNARELGGNWAIQKDDGSKGAGIHRSIQQTLTSNPDPGLH
ncbi:FecR family protein [Sulfuritortus calidifontis]|uniref:FecR family protein n=1 Tax=Sulfuritortus calidifontis TaxID=1914471 RepID=A0A4R3JRM4_9PROT|nr:FecR domain-containing protein [Sulfuritortus calidifontis]TCS69731.1 FecR family protein [Sulfuritortus calidifontis]